MANRSQIDVLLHWARNAKRSQYGHYRMAHRYRARFLAIGATAAVIAAIGGSTYIVRVSSYFPTHANEISLAAGFLLLVSAVLSTVQTLLRYEEKAQRHLSAASRFGAAKRFLAQVTAEANEGAVSTARVDEVRRVLDELADESPQIPDETLREAEVGMPPTPFKEYYPESQRGNAGQVSTPDASPRASQKERASSGAAEADRGSALAASAQVLAEQACPELVVEATAEVPALIEAPTPVVGGGSDVLNPVQAVVSRERRREAA